MAYFEITDVVEGEHPGWRRTYFTYQNRPWNLLTMEGRARLPHSLLTPKDDIKDKPWPHYHIMELDGIITPDAAATIILAVYSAYGHGRMRGVFEQRAAVRKVLGL